MATNEEGRLKNCVVIDLTERLRKTGFPKQLLEAAREGNPEEVQRMIDDFPKRYPVLWSDISAYADSYHTGQHNYPIFTEYCTVNDYKFLKQEGFTAFPKKKGFAASYFVFLILISVTSFYNALFAGDEDTGLFDLYEDNSSYLYFLKALEEKDGYPEVGYALSARDYYVVSPNGKFQTCGELLFWMFHPEEF